MTPNDNTSTRIPPQSGWDQAEPDIAEFKGGPDEFGDWKSLRARVAGAAQINGWLKSDVARKIDMPSGTFSQWYSGSYAGRWDNQNAKVERWLAALEDAQAIRAAAPKKPGFVTTEASTRYLNALSAAQVLAKFSMITSATGTGKIESAEHYTATTPLVTLVTMTPMMHTTFAMLKEIGRTIGVTGGDPSGLVPAIASRLWRTGGGALLIIDEAQHLSDDAINQARHFSDGSRAGVVLIGNLETHKRYSTVWTNTDRYGQLASRVFQRINIDKSSRHDIATIIRAWGISDEKQVEFLTGVGRKPGGLRHIGETITLAMMRATGDAGELTLTDLKKAWDARGLEGGQ